MKNREMYNINRLMAVFGDSGVQIYYYPQKMSSYSMILVASLFEKENQNLAVEKWLEEEYTNKDVLYLYKKSLDKY